MNIKDLRPASDFARSYGCKCLVYGPPGSSKTPLINTAPRPILLACEAGLLSMRGSQVPTFQAFTSDQIDDFFSWWFSSNETKNFDTLAIDSSAQMAEIYLNDIQNGTSKAGNKKHGLQAYGEMADRALKHLRRLYFMDQKHIYLIGKENPEDKNYKRPYFPGNVLNVEVPHMVDFILHCGIHNIPGMGQVLSFQCNQSIDVMARNRTGNLNDFEEPHFGKLVSKAMS